MEANLDIPGCDTEKFHKAYNQTQQQTSDDKIKTSAYFATTSKSGPGIIGAS